MDNLRALLGIAFVTLLCWAFSENRRAINWKLVGKGLIFQFAIAILVLKVSWVAAIFNVVGKVFVKTTSFASYGSEFLLKSYVTQAIEPALVNFLFGVLPIIIFFSALTAALYYLGILQKFVLAFAWLMKRTLGLSGAESLSAAGNIFLGQTEAPLLVRPYLPHMTRSELLCVMAGGMATIAGSVLASYIVFLGDGDPAQELLYAKHLLTASIMSAPAAVISAKILVPETSSVSADMKISEVKVGSNFLEAISNGTTDGIKLAVNVAAMLLVFTALIYMGNYILSDVIGEFTGANAWIAKNTPYAALSFQMLLGYLFAPVAWLLGAHPSDMMLVGQLLGEKTILNEFYAYVTLGNLLDEGRFVSEKSAIIATYVLCGFANFASIGIQIGGIGALAPTRKTVLSELGVKALIAGTAASLYTAAIVALLL